MGWVICAPPSRGCVVHTVGRSKFRATSCAPAVRTARALGSDSSGPYDPALIKATDEFTKAMEEGGLSEDEVIAKIMGAKDVKSLSDVQEQYKDKIKAQLAKKAAELKAKDEVGREEYEIGKLAYERGQYRDAERLLQQALDVSGAFTMLGGEIQMLLALAYSANGKEDDCIQLFKAIENTHPSPKIQKQAADLRYIMEAPKLEVSEDEKIKIPVMALDPNDVKKKGYARRPAPTKRQEKLPKTFEDEFWENYRPPSYLRNKYVWAAAVIIGIGLAVFSSSLS